MRFTSTTSLASRNVRRVAVVFNDDSVAATSDQNDGDEDAEPPSPPKDVADADVADVAACIHGVLKRAGHEVVLLSVKDSLTPLIDSLRALRIERVFNLVESIGGESRREAEIPRLLDELRIPYTGNSAGILRLAQAKDMAKRLLEFHGVPVPRGYAVVDARELTCPEARGLVYPLFVKPARTDASIGIDRTSVVCDRAQLDARLTYLSRHLEGPFVVEEYLPGREINVAIFADPYRGQLVPTEVDFSGYPADYPPIVTYDCKWVPGSPEYVARSLPATERLTPAELHAVRWAARAAFLTLGGTSYGRVDLRFDANGVPRVIDVNPNNDLNPEAGMAIAAASVGMSHDSLINALLDGATVEARHVPAPHHAARPRSVGHAAAAY